ncbi:Asx homology domain-containing protein [Aspergillus crustosus]
MDSKPKRNPRRAAKDRWEEEKLMTSDNSQLIDLDIQKLLALPEAWSCLEESEKKEILDLLPSDTHPNPDPPPGDPDAKIPPLPATFLRSSDDWRSDISHFQLNLQSGRYEPGWIREAEEAVQQRAAGKFDKFKEQEFEEFWGQKQKMDRNLAAGESSKTKLSTLVKHDIVRKGDIWRWSRTFAKEKILIEKEARITETSDSGLTFAVPPGQRVLLRAVASPKAKDMVTQRPEASPTTPPLLENDGAIIDITGDSITQVVEAGTSKKRSAEPETLITVVKRPRGRPRKEALAPAEEKEANFTVEILNPPPKSEIDSSLSQREGNTKILAELQNGDAKPVKEPSAEIISVDEEPLKQEPESNGEADEVLITNIQGPTPLTLRILEVDGRIDAKTAPNGNAWKEIRCYRDNQDIGTLWEVRHAWHGKQR